MIRPIERTRLIEAPPQRLWNRLQDLRRWGEWDPQIRAGWALSEGPWRPGWRGKLVTRWRIAGTVTIEDIDVGKHLVWHAEFPAGVESRLEHRLQSEGQFTRLTFRAEFTGLLATLFGPFLRRRISRVFDRALENLARLEKPRPTF
ncbi:MAG: SRPBCC family protein [Planctomycetota bacterium]